MKVLSLPTISQKARADVIEKFQSKDFFYIQIGANDGTLHDNFRHEIDKYSDWSGILVEPLPGAFKKLQSLYSDNDNVFLENSAISDRTGESDFHLSGTCSALRENINIPKIHKKIKVNTLTWMDFLSKHSIKEVDFLHIDAEGYDCNIVNQVLDTKLNLPKIIEFECNSITPDAESEPTFKRLSSYGYEVKHFGIATAAYDCFAYLKI
jgi:FkbM family methyltransferase